MRREAASSESVQRLFFAALVLTFGALFLVLLSSRGAPRPIRLIRASTQHQQQTQQPKQLTDAAELYASWRAREQLARNAAVRLLFVTDRARNYDAGMSRHFFWVYGAMLRHPRVAEAVLWGRGFPGYDARQTLGANVRARFGAVAHFDAAVVYGFLEPEQVRAVSAETVVAIREHECWDDVCWPRIEGYNASLVFMTYAQDLAAFRNRSARRLFVNAPHGANAEYFTATEDELRGDARSTPVLVAGKVDPAVYPLRARFKAIVENGTWPGGKVRAHPGYWVENTTAEALEQQTRDYASQLKDARIVMLDSSLWRYQFQKYAEVALAGALIVGDVPYQDEAFWSQIVVPVSLDDPDEHYVQVVDWWLEHEEERLEHVRAAQKMVLGRFTYDHTADLMLRSLDKFRSGQFGIWYPYPFSFGCLPINLVKRKTANAWCPPLPS